MITKNINHWVQGMIANPHLTPHLFVTKAGVAIYVLK